MCYIYIDIYEALFIQENNKRQSHHHPSTPKKKDMFHNFVHISDLTLASIEKSSVRFPGKSSKVASTMLYFASLGNDPKLAVQIDSLPVAFHAKVTNESQNKDKCTIALALDPLSETYQKLAAIDLALVKSFLAQRDKDKDMKKLSDQQLIDDCVGGVRAPPDDKPEYSPTFRATVDVRRGPGDEYFLDSDRCKIYDINLQEMTDVQVLPKGSRLIIAATPSWIWTMGSRIGITWSCVTVCVKSTPNTANCPLLITPEMTLAVTSQTGKPLATSSTSSDLEDPCNQATSTATVVGDEYYSTQPNRHELELMFQQELADVENSTANGTKMTDTTNINADSGLKRKISTSSASITDAADDIKAKRSKS